MQKMEPQAGVSSVVKPLEVFKNPAAWEKFQVDEKGGVELRAALEDAPKEPNRRTRRKLDCLARKYGLTGAQALYYWRNQ